MITLNNEKELVRIETWQEILDRGDYVRDIDPSTIALDSIIGSYVLRDPVPCGLSTCHQPHNKGYLVTTKDNKVTNIGNVCGKNHFSVEFQVLANKFNRDIRIKSAKEEILAFMSRIPGYESEILSLRSEQFGADWVYKGTKLLKVPNKKVPESIRKALNTMLRTGNAQVTSQREATREELDAHEVATGKKHVGPMYVDQRHGTLNGLSALREENNLRKILIEDIQVGIERISQMELEGASEHQLRKESKWVGEFEGKLERAKDAVSEGRRLLSGGNLKTLAKLLNTSEERKGFKEFLKNLETAENA